MISQQGWREELLRSCNQNLGHRHHRYSEEAEKMEKRVPMLFLNLLLFLLLLQGDLGTAGRINIRWNLKPRFKNIFSSPGLYLTFLLVCPLPNVCIVLGILIWISNMHPLSYMSSSFTKNCNCCCELYFCQRELFCMVCSANDVR